MTSPVTESTSCCLSRLPVLLLICRNETRSAGFDPSVRIRNREVADFEIGMMFSCEHPASFDSPKLSRYGPEGSTMQLANDLSAARLSASGDREGSPGI